MTNYVIRRILTLIPTLFVVYTLTFFIVHSTPGNPWDQSEKPLPQAVLDNLNKQYHLDDPLYKQYFDYLFNLLQGNFGPSYRDTARSVSDILAASLPVSFQLGLAAMAFAMLFGIPLGILAAVKQNTWIDYTASLVTVTGIATPSFVRATLLVVVLGVGLHWLPTQGWNGPFDVRIIIPTIALGSGPGAIMARYARSSLLDALTQDYLRTARAKGLNETQVIIRHALKNALIPVVTVAGVILADVITGSFFIESISGVPGIGRQFVNSATGRDYPLLLGITLVFASVIAVMNLIVDVAYGFLDPRVRYS